ncbi:glycosyltransferase [Rhodanobacter sp. IGA1.0]|uniref:Glycosyltransferase n=1 Tax=Rhodanobacter sp. IGA1.0 TaxID=3158582 RepID=A0AAU7QNE1_9GAMM
MLTVIIPVYRNADAALRLARTLISQSLPDGHSLEIIAVDDGSGDNTAERLTQAQIPLLRVITLSENRGRAAVRNLGAKVALGEILAFIDCDCLPQSHDLLARHVAMLSQGCVASCGPTSGREKGFWGRYQEAASRRRQKQYENGVPYAGTTANLAVLASAFFSVGGFDEGYRHYGFEDRDILIRLSRIGEVVWCAEATMQHLDLLTIKSVLVKMQRAAGPSAEKFSGDHADAYRALGFSALDTRLHPWLKALGYVTAPLVRKAGLLDRVLDQRWVPYSVAAASVKTLSALAFLQGTMVTNQECSLGKQR